MSTELTKWSPPQEKNVRLIMNGVLIVGGILLAIGGVKLIGPSAVDALRILKSLVSNVIGLAALSAGGVALFWLLGEVFLPSGKINGLLRQSYSSFIRFVTLEMLDYDPISPLTEKRAEMVGRRREFDEAFAQFDGTRTSLQEKEDAYRRDANKKKVEQQAATKLGREEDARNAAYDWGRFNETADDFARMRLRLEPVRNTILRLRGAVETIIRDLDTDIKVTKDKWAFSQSMSKMDKTARAVLDKSAREALAQEAFELVDRKYAEQIGRLENLSDITKPLLDSIDLQKATFNETLLAQVQTEVLQLPGGSVSPLEGQASAPSTFSTLVR